MNVVNDRTIAVRLAVVAAALLVAAPVRAQHPASESADVELAIDANTAPPEVRLHSAGQDVPHDASNLQPNEYGVRLVNRAEADPGYWLGVQLERPSDALRSHLGLAKDEGLLVEHLFPDTPAVKAGFEKYDLLVKVDGEAVKDIEAFNKLVQETKGEDALAITLYRGGKQQTIRVTPAKRPTDEGPFSIRMRVAPGQEDLFYHLVPGVNFDEGPMRIDLFHPGVMMNPLAPDGKLADLPKDLSISISKSADQPAQISVKKGHIKWDVTEKELDKLPADVRPHVERMLGRGPQAFEARTHILRHPRNLPEIVAAPHRLAPPPIAPPAAAPADVQKQLGEMNKRLEKLEEINKVLENLRNSLDKLVKQRGDGGEGAPQK